MYENDVQRSDAVTLASHDGSNHNIKTRYAYACNHVIVETSYGCFPPSVHKALSAVLSLLFIKVAIDLDAFSAFQYFYSYFTSNETIKTE